MEVNQKEIERKGEFYVEENGEILAKMTYVWSGNDRIIIDHTEVSDKLRGTGAGKEMVYKAAKFAEERKISIIPLCPFAKSVFDKNKDLRHVL
jgi:predicted GNAT family acetyltransferase|tara:strand:+ start:8606 stop:8884 length:279 start_codon:yes stop_codon:yes gene_type:complete